MRPKILYIAGTGRSGSTVLARCLEAELDAVHVGEARHVWSRGVDEAQLCECGQPFDECEFWSGALDDAYSGATTQVRQDLALLAPRIDRLRHIPSNAATMIGWRSSPHLQAYGDCVAPLYEAIHRVSGNSLVIDSSKDPSYLVALSATRRVDVQVLHLVRDSRAVAYSWTRKKLRPEIHWEERYMDVLPPARSARRWMEDNAAVDAFRILGPSITRVRYEDFANDPGQFVADLIASIGLSRRRALTRDIVGHSFSGNPMRFDVSPFRVSPDNAWRRELSAGDRRKVALLTAPLLLRYGYPLW